MTYAAVADQLGRQDAKQARRSMPVRRRRVLLQISDTLLGHIEDLNVEAVRNLDYPSHEDYTAIRLPAGLVAGIDAFLAGVGLEARRLVTTAEALDAVYDAQSEILRHVQPEVLDMEDPR